MLTTITSPANVTGVTAKSVAGFGDPRETWRTSAHRDTGAFFMPALRVYGGCAWEPFGAAGFQVSRFANLRTAAPIRCLATAGAGSRLGDPPMQLPTRSPSARAAAHRAMARAALFSASSASVRLKRYNAHMDKARTLEARARAQEVQHG